MSTSEVGDVDRAARDSDEAGAEDLRNQLLAQGLASLWEVLSGAVSIAALGECNQDRMSTVHRVLSLG